MNREKLRKDIRLHVRGTSFLCMRCINSLLAQTHFTGKKCSQCKDFDEKITKLISFFDQQKNEVLDEVDSCFDKFVIDHHGSFYFYYTDAKKIVAELKKGD